MSYDFGIWRRHPSTKTAVIEAVWASITEGHAHPAMGDFDPSEILSELTTRFPSAEEDPDQALIVEDGRDGDAAWIIVHAPHSTAQDHTGVLIEVALEHGLLLWDPQRGVVWGNRRPPKTPDASKAPTAALQLAPTGRLRASINLGNPVLASGTPDQPAGITVALAREIGRRLEVEVDLICFDAAKDSVAAIVDGRADIGFLAVDPGRPLSFTSPYVLIEGVYVVAEDSPISSAEQVDATGTTVGVKEDSAYDLHLTRSLVNAQIVRGSDGIEVYADQQLDVGAGIRQPMTEWVAAHPGHRIVEPAFMQIKQAIAVPQDRSDAAINWLRALVTELLDSGFITRELTAAGQDPSLAALSGP